MKPTCFTNANTTLTKSATCGVNHTIDNLILLRMKHPCNADCANTDEQNMGVPYER